MIVWRGWGILAILIPMGSAIIGAVIIGALFGERSYSIGAGVGVVLSAVAIWIIGKRINDGTGDRVLEDTQTGQQVILRNRHTLFWIGMEWWAIAAVILGIVIIANPTPS